MQTSITKTYLGGLELYELSCGDSQLQVSRFGAQIISGGIAGKNIFFNNPQLVTDKSKALRAGAPICFPWFNKGLNWNLGREITPSHGPARSSDWNLISELIEPESVSLGFHFETNSYLDLAFRILVDYTLRQDTLLIEFTVENLSDSKNAFELALHSYFATQNPQAVSIAGLKEHNQIPFIPAIPIDQIFENATDDLLVNFPDFILEIKNIGFSKSVIWHPGFSHNLSDLTLEPSPASFLCIESLSEKVVMTDKKEWQGSISYKIKT